MVKDKLLKLDLQTFADGGDGGGDGSEGGSAEEIVEDVNAQGEGTEVSTDGSQNTDDQRVPYDRFKQKVDEFNKMKSDYEKLVSQQEQQRQDELEEQEKYKELYEDMKEKLENTHKENVEKDKRNHLKGAGYSDEQVEMLTKLVDGETDEDITASIEVLKETFPVETKKKKYVDPSAGNGQRNTPTPTEGEDVGRTMFERLKNAGKIKGVK